MNLKRKIKIIFITCLSILIGNVFLFAQNFTAQVSSKTVEYGQMFQLVFTINTSASNFSPPNFKDLEVAGGPNQSSSIQVINGAMSQNLSITYILIPKKEGKITIGAASIIVNGRKQETAPITIEVIKGQASAQGGQSSQAVSGTNDKVQAEKGDVFIKTIFSKQKCMLGEQLIISQKVFSRHQIVGFQKFNPPSYDGFWSQALESTSGNQQAVENIDGVNFYTYELFRNQVTPNKSGKIEVRSIEGDVVVRKVGSGKPRNFIEQIFGTGYEDVAIHTRSKPSFIEVDGLPEANKPEGFQGAVGDFTYKVEASKNEVKANDAFNLKVTISGKGNIKLIDAPKFQLPESFETYEPKISETATAKIFDYLIIPREEGDFKLENLDFSYYSLTQKKYITIPSPVIPIKVLPADPNSKGAEVYIAQKRIKEIENDIRYIKKGNIDLKHDDNEFFNSSGHLFLLVLPVILLIATLIWRNRYIKQNSDVVSVKARRAMKLAKKQLKAAELCLKTNNKEQFYSEVLNGINNYIGNKFNIPLSEISKETINTKLIQWHIDSDLLNKVNKTIEVSEYARYAPGAVSGDLNAVYNDMVDLIMKLEDQINTKG